jgi:GDP-D-mannose dehydratase
VSKDRILVVAANGQDGFLTTVLALEQKSIVLALTRNLDHRLSRFASQDANLEYQFSQDYLSNLPRLVAEFSPTHVFYFASEHGPSGTMSPTKQSLDCTEFLTRKIPEVLINLAKRNNFKITFPLSSRMYSGYLEDAKGIIEIDLDTPPKPNDYYGEGKASLLRICEIARDEGVHINSPILFNHGSIFSRPGYVSHAISNAIASWLMSDSRTYEISNPSAQVDLSDAMRVVNLLLNMTTEAYNGPVLVSSGTTSTIADLIFEQSRQVAEWIERPFDKQRPDVAQSGACLTAPTSPFALPQGGKEADYSWLGSMALLGLQFGTNNGDKLLPNPVAQSLPFTFRNLTANQIEYFIPTGFDDSSRD